MGDVVGITDSDGNLAVENFYDAWGDNYTSAIEECDFDGKTGWDGAYKLYNSNPMRYRGYYYDVGIGMYYLQSRYFNPTVNRFFNADDPDIARESKDLAVGMNLFAYCNNDPVNNVDPTGYKGKISWDKVFSQASIVSAVVSAIGTISILAFKKTPWGKLISVAITAAAIGSNLYSYHKAIHSAKGYYGKKSKQFKKLLEYNSTVLAVCVASAIISDILSLKIVKKYSTAIILALFGCRTITIVGLTINLGEMLSGKGVIYRSRVWWR